MSAPHSLRRAIARALAAGLAALWFVADAAPPDTMAQRMLACTACHDDQGRQGLDAYYPRIAGKPHEYLYNQLRHFRDGRRNYPLMEGLLHHMSDAYMMEIARHFAGLDVPYAASEPATLAPQAAARAQALVKQGDAARELPACAACHGDALMGVQPAVPGLLGLPRDYIRAQLGAWRSGTRKAADPDCMAEIARRLTPEEISMVSAWLSARPIPAGARPAKQAARRPPMECGSVLDAVREARR